MASPEDGPEAAGSELDFGSWRPTGRKTAGLDSDLIEIENPDGHKQIAIVFDKLWRNSPLLTTNVDLVRSFLEFPMVDGIACLTRHDADRAIFHYETGSVLPLIEILRAYRDQRKPVGLRAAVELMKSAGRMLQEASENGPMQGIYSHGGLTPWRIVLDAEGNPMMIGYGLPQMDMAAAREDTTLKVREDSFKVCPPERLVSGYEDISTDLYSLVLIAYEMITGESLLSGTDEQLRHQVTHGEAQQRLMAFKGALPKDLKDTLVQALAFDPAGRFEEPSEFVQAVSEATDGKKMDGEDLAAVVHFVRSSTRQGKTLLDVGTAGGPRRQTPGLQARETRMRSATESRPARAPQTPAATSAASTASDERWSRARRSDRRTAEPDEEAPRTIASRPTRRTAPEESEEPRRVRRTEAEPEAPRARRRATTEEPSDEPPRSRRRTTEPEESPRRRTAAADDTPRRVRRATADEGEDAPRRARRSVADNEPATETPATEAPATEAPAPAPPTADEAKDEAPSRRTRQATSDDDDAPSRRKKRKG
jgi:hypothetical protein